MNTLSQDRRNIAIVLAAVIGLLAGIYLGSLRTNEPGISRAHWPAPPVAHPRSLEP